MPSLSISGQVSHGHDTKLNVHSPFVLKGGLSLEVLVGPPNLRSGTRKIPFTPQHHVITHFKTMSSLNPYCTHYCLNSLMLE